MTTTSSARPGGTPWWYDAVVYQVYVRSFSDAHPAGGDGVGDIPGITARLPYLRELGVDALWLTPFYTSPQKDHGYDVADYRDVDPLFGSLDDIDVLLETAHGLDLRVIVDLVPNHTSDQHAWFRAALAAGPGSRERARYLFREGRGPEGDLPPNNWESVFGGPAWTRVTEADGTPGQWYLHLFDSTQPDLDWRNPEVGDMFEDVLRFWLDKGVDGFRVDVAHGLYKEESLRDQKRLEKEQKKSASMVERVLNDEPMWDQPEVHDVYRRWRRVLDSYPGDRMAVAEAWTQTTESMALFVRPDELHQAFNFAWLGTKWSAEDFAEVITGSIAAVAAAQAAPTWVLSNHDVERHPTRYGGGPVGLARGRATTLAMLALPGSAYLYQGEELGLEQVDVPPEARQDPSWRRTGKPGRDGCRVPMPWSGQAPPYGFGPAAGQPWIPQPADWADLTVEAQEADPESTLAFYQRALTTRRKVFTGADESTVAAAEGDLLLIVRAGVKVLLNAGPSAVELPDGEVLISSSPLTADGKLPPDTAVWLR
ncbi:MULTISPECIES: glycoside hydrolase family 13 protein [Nocardioides]|uniref:Glycoside hydrolase family 13 protein n=1 Tax=Nocardioides vastitatis TaxID=2568655 RepID=A0ABW0ZRE2_9ACTN|nr:glycoside hydrolase family 13 protein [Nocardioides sp.]THI96047.1 glycoside hydrolase family 13 protein [Nocardioides sp.]